MSGDLVTSDRMAALLASPREHDGQRVVTFADVDEMHGHSEGRTRKTFNDNLCRFVEGRDFFRVSLATQNAQSGNRWASGAREVIYLTERGYTKVTKTMGDDRSWAVFETLTGVYFDSRSLIERTLAGVLAEVASLRSEIAIERADRKKIEADRFDAAQVIRRLKSDAGAMLAQDVSPRLRVLGECDPKQGRMLLSLEHEIEDRAKARGDGRITAVEAAGLLGLSSTRELGRRVKAGQVTRRYTGTRRPYAIDDVRAVLAPVAS